MLLLLCGPARDWHRVYTHGLPPGAGGRGVGVGVPDTPSLC